MLNNIEKYNENGFWIVFTAGFTPIPYKVFTIAAGLFNLNLFVFITASILGRGLRFFIVAFFMKLFGQKIGELAFRYFNIGSGALAVLIVLFVLYKIFF
jgi:membrane protein YqaA with SNARE-associated domain